MLLLAVLSLPLVQLSFAQTVPPYRSLLAALRSRRNRLVP
jgi:hypothetical protein